MKKKTINWSNGRRFTSPPMPSTLKPYVNKSSLMNAEAYGEIACHTRWGGGNKTANEKAARRAATSPPPPGINGEKNKLTDPPNDRVATSRQITATLNLASPFDPFPALI